MKNMRRNSWLLVVAWMLLGGTLLRSEGWAKTPTTTHPVKRLAVFDSNGKVVGKVIDVFGTLAVIITFSVDDVIVTVGVTRDGFAQASSSTLFRTLFFESRDCSGTPFSPEVEKGSLLPSLILLCSVESGFFCRGGKLYVPDGVEKTIVVQSVLGGDGTCMPVSGFGEAKFPTVRFLIDLGAEFQPPFTLR